MTSQYFTCYFSNYFNNCLHGGGGGAGQAGDRRRRKGGSGWEPPVQLAIEAARKERELKALAEQQAQLLQERKIRQRQVKKAAPVQQEKIQRALDRIAGTLAHIHGHREAAQAELVRIEQAKEADRQAAIRARATQRELEERARLRAAHLQKQAAVQAAMRAIEQEETEAALTLLAIVSGMETAPGVESDEEAAEAFLALMRILH